MAGGWAIDLFLGRITRDHADVELAIFRDDQAQLHRSLVGWIFQKVVDGQLVRWNADDRLDLPVHEIHARCSDDPGQSLEFLLNERTDDQWVFRREPAITLPLERAIVRAAGGLPILSPAIVLLFKAKNPRPKDEMDFRSACCAMSGQDRKWLAAAIKQCHPKHPWLAEIDQ